ncbi:hypothetical protein EON81_19365 [bacterium]|nr:MAG: hypothetical protein EON81_19365 [bacterium]
MRLFWGDQRMGLLKIDAGRGSGTSEFKRERKIYEDVRGWNWCALADAGEPEPFLVVSGNWDIVPPPETSFFRLKDRKAVPVLPKNVSPALRKLESACIAFTKKDQRFTTIQAHRVRGVWKLSRVPAVKGATWP